MHQDERADITVRTALLDARLIHGDGQLYGEFEERFRTEVVARHGARLHRRQDGRARRAAPDAGESRYKVEPNVKDGKGGLRDLHTLHWLSKYLYGQGVGAATVAAGIFTPGGSRRPSAAAKTSCGPSAASCTSSAAARRRC